MNNDAIPMKYSLTTMVEYAEEYDQVAALNGVILQYDGRLIDTAGNLIDELLSFYPIGFGRRYPWILSKLLYISYACGAYALYRTECILKCVGESIFLNEFFGYFDDNMLGLMLWNCGYPSISIPEVVAKHLGSSTFGKVSALTWYLYFRNLIVLSLLTNSRYREYIPLYSIRGILSPTAYRNKLYKIHIRALYDAYRLYERVSKKIIGTIDIYKAPVIPVKVSDLLRYTFSIRRRILEAHEKRFLDLMKSLEVEEAGRRP